MTIWLRRLAIVALCTFNVCSRAETPPPSGADSKDANPYHFGLGFGRLLPYGVYGVRDIYPYWNFRFGHPIGDQAVEWSAYFVHAKDVDFKTLSASLTAPSELEGWKFIPFIGMDLHYYSGHTNVSHLPTSTSLGFHLGVSPILEFGQVALRADFKFNFNPGRTLHVGGGLQYGF